MLALGKSSAARSITTMAVHFPRPRRGGLNVRLRKISKEAAMKNLRYGWFFLIVVGFTEKTLYSFEGVSALGAPACCAPAYSAMSLEQECYEFPPSCCQHVWDGYCAAKQLRGCHKGGGCAWPSGGRLRAKILVGTASCGETVQSEGPAVIGPPEEGPSVEPSSDPPKSGSLMRLKGPPQLSRLSENTASAGTVIPLPPTR